MFVFIRASLTENMEERMREGAVIEPKKSAKTGGESVYVIGAETRGFDLAALPNGGFSAQIVSLFLCLLRFFSPGSHFGAARSNYVLVPVQLCNT